MLPTGTHGQLQCVAAALVIPRPPNWPSSGNLNWLAITAFICHVGYQVTSDVVHRLADGVDAVPDSLESLSRPQRGVHQNACGAEAQGG
jgi:hypothetical protein